jgi:hypothetical protein
VDSARRRLVRRQRLRLLKWFLFLLAFGLFYYFLGHNLVLRLAGRVRQGGEEWATGTGRTFRHIQQRESVGGQTR